MDKQAIWTTVVLPVVRHGLQLLSGVLIAEGKLDMANAETLTGGMIAIATVAWWYFTRPKKAA